MEYEPCLREGKRVSVKRHVSGPDGAEAWGIAMAVGLINLIMAGLARMSGILFVAFIDIFHTDRGLAALPFSVRMSVRNLLGPVVGILGQKYGVRTITVIGSIVGTVSASACFYAPDIVWVTIVWGVINGIGSSLLTILPQVVIGQHFKKYKTTAFGIAFSGGCVGSFLFPALLEFFLHTYGLSGTFLLISGIIMHTIPAAMVLRKPSWWKEPGHSIKIISSQNRGITSDQDIMHTNQHDSYNGKEMNPAKRFSSTLTSVELLKDNCATVVEILKIGLQLNPLLSKTISPDLILEQDVVELCQEIENLRKEPLDNNKNKDHEGLGQIGFKSCNADIIFSCGNDEASKQPQRDNCSRVLLAVESVAKSDEASILSHFPEEKHGLISRLITDLKDVFAAPELKKNPCLPSVGDKIPEARYVNPSGKSNSFLVHIKTALKLHRKPLFLLICLCRGMHFLTLVTLLTTVVDFSMDKGLKENDGKYVIAALSAGDLLGRLCLGWVTDKGYVSIPRYMMIGMVAQGVSTGVLPLMESKATLMVGIAAFGLLQGSVFVRQPVLVSMYLGSQEQSIAMGSINFFPGLMCFILPSYIGYFRDTIGSYDGMFYINGGLGILIGLLWAFEGFFQKLSRLDNSMDQLNTV